MFFQKINQKVNKILSYPARFLDEFFAAIFHWFYRQIKYNTFWFFGLIIFFSLLTATIYVIAVPPMSYVNMADNANNLNLTTEQTYTSTSTHDTQSDFFASGSSGFGYYAAHTSDSFYFNKITPHKEISLTETGLVGLWHFNNNWNDSKGTNHGTRFGTGAPFETTSPKLGTASGKFNGSDNYVNIANEANFDFAGTKFSVEFWFKTANIDTTFKIFISKTDMGTDGFYISTHYNGTSGTLFALMASSAGNWKGKRSTSVVTDKNWHHAVVVFDDVSRAITIYIDGRLEGIDDSGGTFVGMRNNNEPIRIGKRGNGYFFNGLIDEVAIYNRALTVDEIKQHYEAGSPAETSLYRSPRFNLGTKTKVANAVVTRTISSGTDLKAYVRSGNTATVDTDSIATSIYLDTSKAEFDAGLVKTGVTTTVSDSLRPSAQNGEIISTETGLVGLWHMNNNWQDSSGNGNNGTAYNGATFTTSAKLGSHTGQFDGLDDYVDCGNNSSLNIIGALTVEAWVYPTRSDVNYQGIIIKANTAIHTTGYSLIYSAGRFIFKVSWGDSSPPFPINNWYHVVGVFDSGTEKLYVNGQLVVTKTGQTLASNTYSVRVGRWNSANDIYSRFFSGLIDEVAIYNRALTADEIKQHYEAGSPATFSTFESSPIDLFSSYPTDVLALHTDIPNGTSLSIQERSAATEAGLSTAAWTTAQDLTATGTNKINVISLTGGSSNRWHQYRLNGTTNGAATWVVRDVMLIPQPTGYGRLQDITTTSTNVQNTEDNQYYQWLVFGASNKSAAWDVDKVDLITKYSSIDLGKPYQIKKLKFTNSADTLYNIDYTKDNKPIYASTTDWIGITGLTASTTLEYEFDSNGKAMRWVRVNKVSDNSPSFSLKEAIARLATHEIDETTGVYYITDGTGASSSTPGITLQKTQSGDQSFYNINPPNASRGACSNSAQYKMCTKASNGIRNITIRTKPDGSTDGYRIVELSWDDITWIPAPNSTAIGDPNPNARDNGITTTSSLMTNTCIPFFIRTCVPASGVNIGAKSIKFQFEAEAL